MTPSIIRQFLIPEDVATRYRFHDQGDEPVTSVRGLGTLNVFIGANNSGKSHFLRATCKTPSLKSLPDISALRDLEEMRAVATMLLTTTASTKDSYKLIAKIATTDLVKAMHEEAEYHRAYKEINMGVHFLRSDEELKLREWPARLETVRNAVRAIANRRPSQPARVYIPAVRSLRPFSKSLAEVASRDYQFGAEEPLNRMSDKDKPMPFSGDGLHASIRELRLGKRADRLLIDRFSEQLSKRFFSGQDVELIPKETGPLEIKIGKDRERPIHEWGDGTQQIILLTFPLFAGISDQLMLFVEEPELYLHPGMQRDLIEAWTDQSFGASGLHRQIFVATHSSQFIDLTLDLDCISIYQFKKVPAIDEELDEHDPQFQILHQSAPDLSVLADLGVRNSSVLLTNCTIWVEGITDRLYIRRIIDILESAIDARVREDVHYSFVEYGGSNLVHWDVFDTGYRPDIDKIDVKRFCGTLMIIADQDKKKDDKHTSIRSRLGEAYVDLNCREIENILTPEVVVGTMKEIDPKAKPPKGFVWDDYKDESIGGFIEKRFGGVIRKISDNGGTLSDYWKPRFAKLACELMKERDDLTKEAVRLGEAVIRFILKHNPNLAALRNRSVTPPSEGKP